MPGIDLRAHSERMVKFGLVGVLNSGIDVGLFLLLFYGLGWPLLVANTIGYLAGLANSYLLNSRWTFRDPARIERPTRAMLYAAFNLVGLVIGNAVVWLLALAFPAYAAKFASLLATFAWNYWASQRFVFARA